MPYAEDGALELDAKDDFILMRAMVVEQIKLSEMTLVELRDRLDSLRTTLRGLDALLGIEDTRPKGAEAVAVVAREAIDAGTDENRDGSLTIPEIVEELARRGWLPVSEKPESAVRSAIHRLRDRDPRWGLYHGRLYYHDRPLPEEGA